MSTTPRANKTKHPFQRSSHTLLPLGDSAPLRAVKSSRKGAETQRVKRPDVSPDPVPPRVFAPATSRRLRASARGQILSQRRRDAEGRTTRRQPRPVPPRVFAPATSRRLRASARGQILSQRRRDAEGRTTRRQPRPVPPRVFAPATSRRLRASARGQIRTQRRRDAEGQATRCQPRPRAPKDFRSRYLSATPRLCARPNSHAKTQRVERLDASPDPVPPRIFTPATSRRLRASARGPILTQRRRDAEGQATRCQARPRAPKDFRSRYVSATPRLCARPNSHAKAQRR